MIRALMQSKEVSGIIGKGGEIVKQFRKDSGAWINISQGTKGVSTERIVSITGSIDSIVTAFTLITERVEEFQKEGSHQGHGSRSRGGGQTDTITLQLIIPSSQCGSIIGKGGAKVKEINEESEATVQVKNLLPDSTDKIVLVTGSSETVPICIGLMCKVLIETPPKGINIPYNPEGAASGGTGSGFGPGPIRNNTYHDDRSSWMPRGVGGDQFRGVLESRVGGPGTRDRRTGYERPADLRDVIRRGERFDTPRGDRFGVNPGASRSGLLGDGALTEGLGVGSNALVGLLRGLSALTGNSPEASIQALTSLVSAQLRESGPGSLAGLDRELGVGRGIGGPRPLGPGLGGGGGLLGRGLGGGDRGPLGGGSRFGGDQQQVTEVIKVPNEKIGSIIGRGGTKIAEVRQVSGASVTVSKFQEGEDAAKQERTITLEGTSDQVTLAKHLIHNR